VFELVDAGQVERPGPKTDPKDFATGIDHAGRACRPDRNELTA
jgi:hypothetical protein